MLGRLSGLTKEATGIRRVGKGANARRRATTGGGTQEGILTNEHTRDAGYEGYAHHE